MEFRQIRYFLEIYKQGSFSKAASSLGLTQPALSRQIAVLEKELKQSVFDRNTRQLSLTEAGRRLLEKAVKLQDLWQETVESVSSLETRNGKAARIQGDFRISTGGTIAAYVLPQMIKKLRKAHPDLTLQIIEGDLRTSREAVIWGDADLGILTEEEYHSELEYRSFLEDEIVPVAAINHPLASRKTKIKARDLRNRDFVFYHPQSAIRRTVEAQLRKQDLLTHIQVSMELRSVDAVIRSVEAGLGIGFVSRRSARGLAILNCPELFARRRFSLCWRKSRPGLMNLVTALQDFSPGNEET
ncbi:MAG: LysR family transcriptional regulator [Leptospiraceae bacterium]|nr:LysR family transcriptional regulator [Leptospiraceae bacterium]